MATATEAKPKIEKPKKYKFKLLSGRHIEKGLVIVTDPFGNENLVEGDVEYQADKRKQLFPVFESDVDCERFNGPYVNMKKYERVHTDTSQPIQMENPTERLLGETIHAYMTRMQDFQNVVKAKMEGTLKSLDAMKQDDLVSLAESEAIDLTGCKNVDDMRKVIRQALKS